MNYTLIRVRKRSLSLQVNAEGEVVARAPLYYPKFLIDRFVESKSRWVAKRRSALETPKPPSTAHFAPAQLEQFIQQAVAKYASLMRLTPKNIRFTQVHSYWGTCSPSGVLSFNRSLRYGSPEVVTYVVVHELAHLRWHGHGVRFWELVKKTYPPAIAMRKLLRHLSHTI